MIYGDSKMVAIALVKISGYNTPRGIQDGSCQFDLVSIYGILAIVIQMNKSIELQYGFTKAKGGGEGKRKFFKGQNFKDVSRIIQNFLTSPPLDQRKK